MKSPILLILTSATILLFSCSNDFAQDQISEDMIFEIALSKEYRNYTIAFYHKANLIATKSVDLEAISQYLDTAPSASTWCDRDIESVSQIRGGKQYLELTCEFQKAYEVLDQVYSYRHISEESKKRIREEFKKTYPELFLKFARKAFESRTSKN